MEIGVVVGIVWIDLTEMLSFCVVLHKFFYFAKNFLQLGKDRARLTVIDGFFDSHFIFVRRFLRTDRITFEIIHSKRDAIV